MPHDPWTAFVAIIGAVIVIMNIIDRFLSFRDRAKMPEAEQNLQIKQMQNDIIEIKLALKKHDEYFGNDKSRLDTLERETKEVNTIVIKSLQALTEHALNGSNNDQLVACSKEMNEYLINR